MAGGRNLLAGAVVAIAAAAALAVAMSGAVAPWKPLLAVVGVIVFVLAGLSGGA